MTRRAETPLDDGLFTGIGRLLALGAVTLACVLALLVQMAPLGLAPRSWPAPDLLYCVLAYAALARPDALSVMATFFLALMGDLVTGGPVGAGALALFLTLEALKRHAALAYTRSRLRDWAAVALGSAVVMLAPWLMLRLTFAGSPPLADLALRWALTVIAFVPVGAAMRYGLRIRRPALRDTGPLWGER
jgi:cell shape-determining protein MreD